MCREEARGLASLKPQLDAAGVRMLAVVHENKEPQIEEFRNFYVGGEIFLDREKRFYGPKERWLPIWHGVLRWDTYANAYRAKHNGVQGNMKGEGRLLGGVFMFNSGEKGVAFEHYERSWGDHANLDHVRQAIEKIRL